MAQDETSNASTGGEAQKKRLPLKTLLLILGLLAGEAVAVFVIASMWAAPAKVEAGGVAQIETQTLEQLNELLIVEDRFPNHQTGRVWLWDTEVQVQVKQKHLDYVERVLEERRAEIKTGISQIWRNAHQRHLTEPDLATLNRQTATYLNDIFGADSEGETRIQRVLIPKCVGFPADF
jgi:hypothetical protein